MIRVKCGPFKYEGKSYKEAQKNFEQGAVYSAMLMSWGNKSDAARLIGMSRTKLCRVFDTLPKFQQQFLLRGPYHGRV